MSMLLWERAGLRGVSRGVCAVHGHASKLFLLDTH